MKAAKSIFLFVLLLTVGGCEKKRYPENVVRNEAVFYFDGIVDGSEVRLNAGEDNYYMYSSHARRNDGLYAFTGAFRKTDCAECGSSLDITINNSAANGDSTGVLNDSTFSLRPRRFSSVENEKYQVTFQSDFNRTASAIFWEFGDGGNSTETNPAHVYGSAGVYNVCLTITGNNGCRSTLCRQVEVGPQAFRSEITAQPQGDGSVVFSQNTTGTGPFSFVWDFGDNTPVSTSPSVRHTYSVTGSYPVTLRVKDAGGRWITTNYNFVSPKDLSSCASNFRLSSVSSFTVPPFSQASITWRDAGGNTYSSGHIAQPENRFEILDVSDYDNNENGERVKKVKVRFNCDLSDGIKKIAIRDAEAVIGVSYH